MDVKNLIPWGRSREVSAPRYMNEVSPFLALHREMDRLMDDFMRGFDLSGAHFGWSARGPHVEVSETDQAVRVVAELPRLEEKDIDLALNENELTLKGEKKAEAENPTYSECWYGRFERTIQLGPDIDPGKVVATFKNGVLTVTIDKRPNSQRETRRVAITSS